MTGTFTASLDDTTPGGVYLCQVSDHVSCGACCGLYNIRHASRNDLCDILARRTEAFENSSRHPDAIYDFSKKIRGYSPIEYPYQDFYHCPFLGLIGEDLGTVGCLLHPLGKGNDGLDFRGLSFYGAMACRTYFCPSCRNLAPMYKKIVRYVCNDWYLYGLILTEWELLQAFFLEIETRLHRPLQFEDVWNNSARIEAFRKLFQVKLTWAFRPLNDSSPCNFFFNDRQYPKPNIDYSALNLPISRYHIILRELKSAFMTYDALHQAETLLDELFENVAPSSLIPRTNA